jgi:hypothetical protein
MILLVRIGLLALTLLWIPVVFAVVPLWLYTFRFGPAGPVGLAILIDWYYLATVPYLTLAVLFAVVTVPFVQRRLMFYTR